MTSVDQSCTCSQHGNYCEVHPTCACGCERHEHSSGEGACIAGSMNCHGCETYRPAQLKRFHELADTQIDEASVAELRLAYKDLRAHHVEETTALWTKIVATRSAKEIP